MRTLRLLGIGLAACVAAHSAQAADVAAPAYDAPPTIGTYDWAGCYLGAEGGGNWGTSRHDAANAGALSGQTITGDFGMAGSLVGGTIGCNYQNGSFVLGIEDDMSWSNNSGSAFDVPPFDPFTVSTTNVNWIDTLRARVGLAWDRWLGYATAGGAFAGTGVSVCNTLGCANDAALRVGWTLGAGVEYAMTRNWTLKVEYLYANFGTARYINPPVALGPFTAVTRNVTLSDSIARVGVNYKFDLR